MTAPLVRWWGPLVLYMGAIFWGSSRPRPGILSEAPDYLLHGGEYFVLALLAVRAFAKGLVAKGPRDLASGVALAVLYGASDEWHQSFVPTRDASVSDVISDAGGAVLAGAILALLYAWSRRKIAR